MCDPLTIIAYSKLSLYIITIFILQKNSKLITTKMFFLLNTLSNLMQSLLKFIKKKQHLMGFACISVINYRYIYV